MSTISITLLIIAVAGMSGCALTPADPQHVRRDQSSICRAGDPYCQSSKPVLNENGDMVRNLPKN